MSCINMPSLHIQVYARLNLFFVQSIVKAKPSNLKYNKPIHESVREYTFKNKLNKYTSKVKNVLISLNGR